MKWLSPSKLVASSGFDPATVPFPSPVAMPVTDPVVEVWLRLTPLSPPPAASPPTAPGNSGFSTPAVLVEAPAAAMLAATTGSMATPVSTARIRDLSPSWVIDNFPPSQWTPTTPRSRFATPSGYQAPGRLRNEPLDQPAR